MKKQYIILFVLSYLLCSCASRGWKLAEQIPGYDNNLNIKKNRQVSSIKENNLPSAILQTTEKVPTTIGEDGLLINPKGEL